MHALAINWWTCHEELEDQEATVDKKEMKGLELKKFLPNVEILSFLFLSTLCLHHHLHESHGQLDLEAFKELHQGLGVSELLPQIYEKIRVRSSRFSCPELSRKVLRPRRVPESWLPNQEVELQACVCMSSTPSHELAGVELWAAVLHGLLFFSFSPSAPPEAFIALQELKSSVRAQKIVLESHGSHVSRLFRMAQLKVDGSWKEIQLLKVELLLLEEQSEQWQQSLSLSSV